MVNKMLSYFLMTKIIIFFKKIFIINYEKKILFEIIVIIRYNYTYLENKEKEFLFDVCQCLFGCFLEFEILKIFIH